MFINSSANGISPTSYQKEINVIIKITFTFETIVTFSIMLV